MIRSIRLMAQVALLAATTVVLAQPLPAPSSKLVLFNENPALTAAGSLTGRGVNLGGPLSQPAFTPSGAEIVWKEVRNVVDPRGGRHVFYRQTVGDAEVYGSEIGVHFTKAGVLRSISGTQFNFIAIANRPVVPREQAWEHADARLRGYGSFHAEDPKTLVPSQRAARLADTSLQLVERGKAFHYAWSMVTQDALGAVYRVVMDAQSEEILALTPANPDFNCYQSAGSSVTATGYPVRAGVAYRSIKANTTSDRPWPFTHEGFYAGSPNISVIEETADPAFMCSGTTRAYTLFPLFADSGTPTYRDRTGYPWHGNAAGDAMFQTRQTMNAFASMGRAGWDGAYGDANIGIENTYEPFIDNAFFINFNAGDPRLPPTRTVITTPVQRMYEYAAALDVIAHEWGHGVIFTSANFNNNQLHEGFADVIGQMVEKMKQPSGSGIEQSSDWNEGEDVANSGYFRSGSTDDGTAGHSINGPGGSYTFNDAFHRDDESGNTEAHNRGNMMNVVFRLLSDGGTNPVCARLPTLSGCSTSVTGQGFSKASTILFQTVEYYAPSTSTWEDLATYASQAAFDNYERCDALGHYPATAEQNAVNNAFTAIGYPRLTSANTCF